MRSNTEDKTGSGKQILIWGAGAIGGTVGAYLSRAGFDITAVDANEAHVRAVRERGLAITGPIETFTQKLAAFPPAEVTGAWENVFLSKRCIPRPPRSSSSSM